jgi:hypothetical protein
MTLGTKATGSCRYEVCSGPCLDFHSTLPFQTLTLNPSPSSPVPPHLAPCLFHRALSSVTPPPHNTDLPSSITLHLDLHSVVLHPNLPSSTPQLDLPSFTVPHLDLSSNMPHPDVHSSSSFPSPSSPLLIHGGQDLSSLVAFFFTTSSLASTQMVDANTNQQ